MKAMMYRRWVPFGRFFLFATLLMAMNFVTGSLSAGVFEVKGIKVDVTATSVAEARSKALAEGERQAFRHLLERLTLRGDHVRLPDFNARDIATFVRDFAVAEEKASDVRYLATLNYRFKPGDVRRLLLDMGISFAETVSKPVLVLPVYNAAGALLLWDDPNPWREAWASMPDRGNLVPTMLPKGDLADIALIGPEQAVDGDEQRLTEIARRYDAGDTLVANASLNMDRGVPDLQVEVTRYGETMNGQTVIRNFRAGEDETLDQITIRAAEELVRSIEDNWKVDNLLQFDQQAVVAVKIKIGGLPDWLKIRERLEGVAVIRRSDLVILSLDEVRVNLHYIGDPEQLDLALRQADLRLVQEGDGWVLESTSANQGS